MPAQQKWLSRSTFLVQFVLDKIKKNYRPMSILVRREQDKLVFRMKTAANHDTAKLQAGAEISRFEVPSLEGFFFRSQQLTHTKKIVYACIDAL